MVRSIVISVSVCMYVCLSVCLSLCLFFCPLPYCQNHMSEFHQIFRTCYLWPWLGPALTAMRYIMYFRFCGWRSCFGIMVGKGTNQRRRICFEQFARWRHRVRSMPSPTASCCWCYERSHLPKQASSAFSTVHPRIGQNSKLSDITWPPRSFEGHRSLFCIPTRLDKSCVQDDTSLARISSALRPC